MNGSQDAKAKAAKVLCAIASRGSASNASAVASASADTSRPITGEPASALRTEPPARLVVRCGAIAPLTALVANGNDQGQIAAAGTLAALANAHADIRLAIADARAVTPLVQLLRKGSNKAAAAAAAALSSLSELAAVQAPIVTAGGVLPLVRLLRMDLADSQYFAAAALSNVCAGSAAVQNAAAAAGAVPALISMLQSGKVQTPAAVALAKLAAGNETICAEITRDGLAPLLALLNGANVPAKVQAAAAIAELSRGNAETQASVARAGGLRPLIAMLEGRNTGAAQVQGARALASVSDGHRANQNAIARLGGLQALIHLLDVGLADREPHVQAAAARALSAACHLHKANQSFAAELGVTSMLVNLLHVKRPDQVKAGAASAVWALCTGGHQNRKRCQSAVALLVALLAPSTDETAAEHAANALAALSEADERNQALITAQLVDLLGRSSNATSKTSEESADERRQRFAARRGTQSNAISLLWRLLEENEGSHHVVRLQLYTSLCGAARA